MKDKIKDLTGLTETTINGYIKIYPKLLIHQVAEQALDSTNGSLKNAIIKIPNVGELHILEDESYDFIPDKWFHKDLMNAMKTGESPIEKMAKDRLSKRINSQYDSLI